MGADLIAIKDLVLGFLGVGISGFIMTEVHGMRKSIEQLNIQLAVLLEKNSGLSAEQKALVKRVEKLEEQI